MPRFQALERLQGDLPTIEAALEARVAAGQPLWVEVVYSGAEIRTDLGDILHRMTTGSPVEILRIRNQRRTAQLLSRTETVEALEDLAPSDVFARCLEAHQIRAEDRPQLTTQFAEILRDLRENPADQENGGQGSGSGGEPAEGRGKLTDRSD